MLERSDNAVFDLNKCDKNGILKLKLFPSMKKISVGQKKLIAEFLANIGVAWFAAGVISIFISGTENPKEIFFSIIWGLVLSFAFLLIAASLLKGVKS